MENNSCQMKTDENISESWFSFKFVNVFSQLYDSIYCSREVEEQVESPSSAEAGESPDGEDLHDEWAHPRKHDRGQRQTADLHRRKQSPRVVVEHRREDSLRSGDEDSESVSVASHHSHHDHHSHQGPDGHHEPHGDHGRNGHHSHQGPEHVWFEAVRDQDMDIVTTLINDGFPIDSIDDQGWSALHFCAWNNYGVLSDLLVRRGCDVDVRANKSDRGCTPLSLAAQCGHDDLVRDLLNACSDVTLTFSLADNTNVTALHLAAENGHVEVVKKLIGAGAVINASMCARGIDGVTPLHLAVQNDHLDIMDILIAAGCDVHSSTTANPTDSKTADNKESLC